MRAHPQALLAHLTRKREVSSGDLPFSRHARDGRRPLPGPAGRRAWHFIYDAFPVPHRLAPAHSPAGQGRPA